MSGHSKWATIKHQKGAKDKARGKLFAKILRQVEVAAREGGGDPESNATLRTMFQKARDSSVPMDTIERLRSMARLYGVFMLPSQGELDLEYLSRLHTVQVVDEASLKQREARARRAMDIIDDAAGEERTSLLPEERRRRDSQPADEPLDEEAIP